MRCATPFSPWEHAGAGRTRGFSGDGRCSRALGGCQRAPAGLLGRRTIRRVGLFLLPGVEDASRSPGTPWKGAKRRRHRPVPRSTRSKRCAGRRTRAGSAARRARRRTRTGSRASAPVMNPGARGRATMGPGLSATGTRLRRSRTSRPAARRTRRCSRSGSRRAPASVTSTCTTPLRDTGSTRSCNLHLPCMLGMPRPRTGSRRGAPARPCTTPSRRRRRDQPRRSSSFGPRSSPRRSPSPTFQMRRAWTDLAVLAQGESAWARRAQSRSGRPAGFRYGDAHDPSRSASSR